MKRIYLYAQLTFAVILLAFSAATAVRVAAGSVVTAALFAVLTYSVYINMVKTSWRELRQS